MIQATLTGSTETTTGHEDHTNTDTVAEDQSLKTGWKWSDSLTDDVVNLIIEPSIKVCPGHMPIGNVNVDKAPLREIAKKERANFTVSDCGEIIPTKDAHPAIGGKAVQGDYRDLPYEDGRFNTSISDPPWKDMSKADRQDLLQELARVTRLGGRIIINAPWISNNELAQLQDIRLRQDEDFWGGPSNIAVYRKYPENPNEKTELKQDHEKRSKFKDTDPKRKESFLGRAISEQTKTDPRFVDPTNNDYLCPNCSSPRLGHVHEMYESREMSIYECLECEFRAIPSEITPDADK